MSDIDHRRKEFEELAPWFAAGLLSPQETARFEAALAQDGRLRANVEAARAELAATIEDVEATGMPSPAAWARVAAAVGQHPYRPTLSRRLRDACAALVARAALAPVGATAAAAVAALVIGVQSGALVYEAMRESPTTYQTASGDAERAQGPQALVVFAPDLTVARVAEILAARGAAIVDGPRAGGIWRVALGAGLDTSADIDKAVAALRAEKGVVSVLLAR